MREKLIELLKECCNNGTECTKSCFECLAAGIVANGMTIQGWTPLAEQPPKKRGHYFIAYKFKGSDMRFFGEAMWHDDLQGNGLVEGNHFSNEGVEGMYVTHWMEIPKLPEPPKEDAE